jgi:hypothetical protein
VALSDALSEVKYKAGQNVVTQGETGDKFFVIQSGTVKCLVDPGDGGKAKEVLRLGPGSYFGERALLSNNPRAASVIAVSSLTCLQISRNTFEDVLGPLQTLIEDDQKRRESRGRKVTRKAAIQHKGASIQDIAQSSHFDFSFLGTWAIDEGSFTNDVAVVRHNRGKGKEWWTVGERLVNGGERWWTVVNGGQWIGGPKRLIVVVVLLVVLVLLFFFPLPLFLFSPLPLSSSEFNMRRFNKCNVNNQNLNESVLRCKSIMSSMKVSNRGIADLLATYVDENCLWMLLGGSVLTMSFDDLMHEADGGQVLSEGKLVHASILGCCTVS